jgi:hypothetical protein
MGVLSDPTIGLTCRLLLILVLGSALAGKLRAPRRFMGIVSDYRIFPRAFSGPAVGLVMVGEAFASLGLWWPSLRPLAAGVAAFLLLVYAAAIAVNLLRGRDGIDCGCSFGSATESLSWMLVARNLVLVGVALAAGWTGPMAGIGLGWLVALAAALTLSICYRIFDVLASHRPRLARLRAS